MDRTGSARFPLALRWGFPPIRACTWLGSVVAIGAIVATGLLALPIDVRAQASGRAQASLVGVWLRVEHAADEADRARAIEHATADMPVLIRRIARGVMRRSIHPVERYEIRPAGPGLTIRADGAAPVGARLDGGLDRDPSAEVRSFAREVGFEQHWRTDRSTYGRTRWRLIDGARRLVVTTRVEDARFSAPLVYETRYERLLAGGSP